MMAGGLPLTELPGVRRFCEQVVEDLLSGRSVFCLVPRRSLLDTLVDVVSDSYARRDLRVGRVDILAVAAGGHSPGATLLKALEYGDDLAGPAPAPETLIRLPDWPDLIVVRGLSALSPEQQARWCRFATEWGWAVHGAGAAYDHRSLLFAVTAGAALVPPSDNRLVIRRLWGHVSQSEMHWLARRSLAPSIAGLSWSEMVHSELAGTDTELLDGLLSAPELDGAELVQFLAEFGLRLGWTRGRLADLHAGRLLDISYVRRARQQQEPPSDLAGLWNIGALYWTAENGMELHSAALAILDRQDVLEHRIWRSQVRALFPVLDAVRRDICHYLTRQVGPGWPHWAVSLHPGDVQGSPAAPVAEWTHLYAVVSSGQMHWRMKEQLLEPVFALREARNTLAHYEAVRRTDFDRVTGALQSLERVR